MLRCIDLCDESEVARIEQNVKDADEGLHTLDEHVAKAIADADEEEEEGRIIFPRKK